MGFWIKISGSATLQKSSARSPPTVRSDSSVRTSESGVR